jgi:hypothetical protein
MILNILNAPLGPGALMWSDPLRCVYQLELCDCLAGLFLSKANVSRCFAAAGPRGPGLLGDFGKWRGQVISWSELAAPRRQEAAPDVRHHPSGYVPPQGPS